MPGFSIIEQFRLHRNRQSESFEMIDENEKKNDQVRHRIFYTKE